ncbi:MAG: DUF624 domain-containing protein [Oscillospiraceae bacterium]|nr:DUF624 domain-containing protein [Oscillospiraceae bacterium]
MGLFSGKFEKEGAGLPMPEGGPARYFSLLFSNIWKLMGANVLFVLFSLPLITLPAALCALNRVCILIYKNGSCYLWQDFVGEFRASFLRSLLPALLFLALLFAGYYFMSLGLTNAALPLWSTIFWAIGIFFVLAGLGWGGYFFVLVAMLEQENRNVLKNARLLCMISPGKALMAALTVIGGAALTAAFMPLSIFLVLLIIPAIVQYTVSYLVYELAEDYILT